MKEEEIYSPDNDGLIDQIEEKYDWYCWEEQDWEENKYMYEYDLEHLEELSKREKM